MMSVWMRDRAERENGDNLRDAILSVREHMAKIEEKYDVSIRRLERSIEQHAPPKKSTVFISHF